MFNWDISSRGRHIGLPGGDHAGSPLRISSLYSRSTSDRELPSRFTSFRWRRRPMNARRRAGCWNGCSTTGCLTNCSRMMTAGATNGGMKARRLLLNRPSLRRSSAGKSSFRPAPGRRPATAAIPSNHHLCVFYSKGTNGVSGFGRISHQGIKTNRDRSLTCPYLSSLVAYY